MADLIEMLDDSSGEVECYLDPDSEVFFGPVTEREREIRRPLPRRTLHPCEITEISRRGMNFHEWEEFKEQVHRNQLNDDAIQDVFGEDDTVESFASCYTSRESDPKLCEDEIISRSEDHSTDQSYSELNDENNEKDISGIESLNDTWEIQERMLAFAERLERGEDIPELGICNSSGKIEDGHQGKPESHVKEQEEEIHVSSYSFQLVKNEIPLDKEEQKENFYETFLKVKRETVCETEHGYKLPHIEVKREPATKALKEEPISELTKEIGTCFITKPSTLKTPTKFQTPTTKNRKPITPTSIQNQTPIRTPRTVSQRVLNTPTQTNISSRPASSIKQASCVKQKQHCGTPSPVGMYIRSLPEPILIENIRSSQKKKQIPNVPSERPTMVAVKLEDGRWGTVKEHSCPPHPTPIPEDYKPILPVVLHEAAASMIHENPAESSLPGTTGKIGQLLKRGVTPTVLKHQGRIQLSNSACKPSRIMETPKSMKTDRTRPDVLEVSVLETVSTPTNYRPLPRLVKSARK